MTISKIEIRPLTSVRFSTRDVESSKLKAFLGETCQVFKHLTCLCFFIPIMQRRHPRETILKIKQLGRDHDVGAVGGFCEEEVGLIAHAEVEFFE